MTSIILKAETDELLQTKLSELCDRYSIGIYDRTVIYPEKETSFGIDTVKKIQEKAILKPLMSPNKALIIMKSNLLTIPSQNALLKLLEEPPPSTYFFLLTPSTDMFLPTILSRCQLIAIPSPLVLSDSEKKAVNTVLDSLPGLSIGACLKLAEKLSKDKQEAITYIKNLIIIGEGRLHTIPSALQTVENIAFILSQLQQTYRILATTNTNTRLALEHLFLTISTKNKG